MFLSTFTWWLRKRIKRISISLHDGCDATSKYAPFVGSYWQKQMPMLRTLPANYAFCYKGAY